MGIGVVEKLAGRFVEATVDMWGADEGTVNKVLKKVHDHGVQKAFEKEIKERLGQERVQELLAESKTISIVHAILISELGGSELKRAEDFYEHGQNMCRAESSELHTEGALAVFDASSTSKRLGYGAAVVALGVTAFFSLPIAAVIAAVGAAGLIVAANKYGDFVFENEAEFCNGLKNSGSADGGTMEKVSSPHALSGDPAIKPMTGSPKGRQKTATNLPAAEQIQYKGVFYKTDDCFDSVTNGSLPEDNNGTLAMLEKLTACEKGKDIFWSGYYQKKYDDLFNSGSQTDEATAETHKFLGRQNDTRLNGGADGGAGDPSKAIEHYKESINYRVDNDVIRDGIMVGIANMLLEDTGDFIWNSTDALTHDFQPGDYDFSQDINRALLEAQKYIKQKYVEEQNPARKAKLDELYQFLMREKYQVICEQGYQYRQEYCDYLSTFIAKFEGTSMQMLAPE